MSELLWNMYVSMLRIRIFENRLADLVESNEVKTPCHLYVGQEAVATGVCSCLTDDDLIWGNHRSHGHYLAKGGDLSELMSEIFGKENGCSKGRGGSMHVIDNRVGIPGTVPIVAATIPLAVGAGFKFKLQNQKKVSVAFFGDGAIEEGVFHESVNMASINNLPVLFVCENNFYSSHLHLLERRKKDNIISVGEYHGIKTFIIDGNDVETVYQATKEALDWIYAGNGPVFMECRTFRWRGHVGASFDMDVGVTRKGELQEWMQKDPIALVEAKLKDRGYNDVQFEQIQSKVKDEVEDSVVQARNAEYPKQDRVFRHVFSD